jgi:hypothetical protein
MGPRSVINIPFISSDFFFQGVTDQKGMGFRQSIDRELPDADNVTREFIPHLPPDDPTLVIAEIDEV